MKSPWDGKKNMIDNIFLFGSGDKYAKKQFFPTPGMQIIFLQNEQLTKLQLFSLKMATLTILSEILVILCICSACDNIYLFFSV